MAKKVTKNSSDIDEQIDEQLEEIERTIEAIRRLQKLRRHIEKKK